MKLKFNKALKGIPISLFILISQVSAFAQLYFAPRTDYPASAPTAIVEKGDLNGDNIPDLVVPNGTILSIYLGTGSGAFNNNLNITLGGTVVGVAIRDFNGDNIPDIAAANNLSSVVSILIGTGTGTFNAPQTYAVGSGAQRMVAADFNGDTKIDLAITVFSNSVSVLLGTGTGTFNPVTNYSTGTYPVELVTKDFNADGILDLATSNLNSNNVSVLLGNGAGGFSTSQTLNTGTNNGRILSEDFNSDGKPDLVVSNNSTRFSVFTGTGTGTFNTPQHYEVGGAGGLRAQDFNGDAKMDLAVGNFNTNSIGIFYGDGAGNFALSQSILVSPYPYYFLISDLNGDTLLDIVSTSLTTNNFGVLLGVLPPKITSFAPASGPIGTSVTITGTNFSTIPSNNIVYFGATRATVTAATSTQFTVTVPAGATYQPITVQVYGSISYSSKPFVVTFSGGGNIDLCSFAPAVLYGSVSQPAPDRTVGDVDGDGKTDLMTCDRAGNLFSIYKNTSTPGLINSGSFSSKADFTTADPVSSAFGELDGDGNPDLVVASYNSGTISVFRNQSTPGTISLSASVNFSAPGFISAIAIHDIDGDGKAEILITSNFSGLTVYRNTATVGTINASSFATGINFSTGPNPFPFSITDLDGDNKPDVIVPAADTHSADVLRNTSTAAVISFAPSLTLITGAGISPIGLGAAYSAIGDIDGDAKQDIVITNHALATFAVFKNISSLGVLSFEPRLEFASLGIAGSPSLSDLDGDGKVDLVGYGTNSLSLLKNNSTGGVIDATSFNPLVSVPFLMGGIFTIADMDGDGRNDLVTTSATISVLHNVIGTISPPSITFFTPSAGTIGTSVTITGTNFDITPANNIIKFNGVTATVTASTATSITTTVPFGTTTGTISVMVDCSAATSAGNFIVTPPDNSIKFSGAQESQLGTWFNYQYFTISMWVKPGATQVPNAVIIDNYHDFTTSWVFQQDGSALNQYTFYAVGSVTLATNTWQHVTLVANNGTYSVYINGCLANSTTYTPITYDGTQSLKLGNWGRFAGRNWKGELDEVRIYDRALSDTEIKAGMYSQESPAAPNLLAYYKMNETGGTTISDATSNARTATLINTPTFQLANIPPAPPIHTINSFTPTTGLIGTSVTITGTNFDLTPSNNIVKFNGITATVTASTATSITTTVPAGATSGTISVQVGCNTVTSATSFTVTQPDNSIKFNGADQEAQLGTWFNYQNFTISMWLKPGATQLEYADIIDNNHNTSRSWVFQKKLGTANTYTFSAAPYAPSEITLTANVWQYVTLKMNSGASSIYLNGCFVSSASGSIVTYDGTQTLKLGDWSIGQIDPYPNRSWNGEMDEVRIYDRVLSDTEIVAGYYAEESPTAPNLVAYYKMNEVGGTIINDATSNGRTGTLINTPTFQAANIPPPIPVHIITSFTPSSGFIGTSVVIIGTNFDLTPANNIVKFNGAIATVTASTTTSITTSVPTATSSGTISVTIGCNTVTSVSNFIIPPPINNKVFYSRDDQTIWATSGDGSSDQFITNGYFPRVSADGRYLLFLKGPNSGTASNDVYTRDLATNVETHVFTNSDFVVGYSWSPDAGKIIFDYSCNIMQMNRDGSGLTTLQSAHCYDDAPQARGSDGKIVFHNQFFGLITINSDGSGRQVIPNTQPFDFWPSWSPDGQWISFSRYTTGSIFIAQYKIKEDGTGLTQLTNLAAGETLGNAHAWTNDGSSIIMSGLVECHHGLFQITADGSQVIKRISDSFTTSNPDFVGTVIGSPPLAYLTNSAPTITSFSPASGPWGTSVTITGTNFDVSTTNNIVKFNGVTATVTASTTTSITTTVPGGATTGTISILAGCNTATSATNFTMNDLVAYYTFTGNANDASGYGNNGTPTGATLTNGITCIPNTAYQFDGNDYIRIMDNPSLRPATNLTLAGWYKFNSTGGAQLLIDKHLGSGFFDSYEMWVETGKLWGAVGNTSGFGPFIEFPFVPTLNTWYHLAYTFNDATNMQQLYINGAMVAQTSVTISISYDAEPLFLGASNDNNTPQTFFDGAMDEVRIYNRDLSANEINTLATPIASPSITSFTPATGGVGTSVTITGTNFDPVPTNNIVKFNGATATVTASTATSITTTVPAGATTGTLTVQAGCNTATSSGNFIVNEIPTGGNQTVAFNEDVDFTFGLTNFTFNDSDGTFTGIQITSLETTGDLEYNGVDVTIGALCPDVTLLVFKPTANANGVPYTSFNFKVKDNLGALSAASYTMTVNVTPVNDPPIISSQRALSTSELTALTILITDVTVSDPDNTIFTLSVQDGVNYARGGNIITPNAGFSGLLSVPVIVNDGIANSSIFTMSVTVISNSCVIPNAPSVTGGQSCGNGPINLNATGATGLQQYRWYSTAAGGSSIVSTSGFTTPILTATTIYYVSVFQPAGSCESIRTAVTATVNTPPPAPSTTGATGCSSTTFTLTAAGGSAGQYRWYAVASGGTAIAGQTSGTFITPTLSTTTTYYVATNNGLCESTRTSVTATVQTCITNQPPAIAATTVQAPVEGKVAVSLAGLLSDPDNNLDLSTLKIIIQPASGAKASVDASHNLILDYQGISFSGTEKLTIEVCDLLGACAQKELSIEVVGGIIVYNAISPNSDGSNDVFLIEYIEALEETKKNHVSIYNRWGDLVFDVTDYNNKTHVFRGINNGGNEVPSGTYFYKIEFISGKKTVSGYLEVKQ